MWASLQAGCLPFQLRCEIGTRGPGVDRYALRERPAYSAYYSTLAARLFYKDGARPRAPPEALGRIRRVRPPLQTTSRSPTSLEEVVDYIFIQLNCEANLRLWASRDAGVFQWSAEAPDSASEANELTLIQERTQEVRKTMPRDPQKKLEQLLVFQKFLEGHF